MVFIFPEAPGLFEFVKFNLKIKLDKRYTKTNIFANWKKKEEENLTNSSFFQIKMANTDLMVLWTCSIDTNCKIIAKLYI